MSQRRKRGVSFARTLAAGALLVLATALAARAGDEAATDAAQAEQTLSVPEGRGAMARLRLRADDDIDLIAVRTTDMAGTVRVHPMATTLRAGSPSPPVEIEAGRTLTRIAVIYRPVGLRPGTVRIDVLGDPVVPDWVLLASRSPGYVGVGRTVVPIGAEGAHLRRLKLQVRERAIVLREVRIVYDSGPDHVLPVGRDLRRNDVFGPIEVAQAERSVVAIHVRYRAHVLARDGSPGAAALVEVWGQN